MKRNKLFPVAVFFEIKKREAPDKSRHDSGKHSFCRVFSNK